MNSPFSYQNGALHAEAVPLETVAARFGTPCYVYSKAALVSAYGQISNAFAGRDHLICYAVKANPNIGMLNLFANMGSGFDIVSSGELQRVLMAGGDASKVVFSGVGKRADEMQTALEADILCFNIESEPELDRLSRVAQSMKRTARISLRVNPDVDAKTHPYISTGLKQNKFGIPHDEALRLYEKAKTLPGIEIAGIDCHIGSQLTELAPIVEALEKMLALVDALAKRGIVLSHIDMGGGVGIRYKDEQPPAMTDYANALIEKLEGRSQQLILEPGRFLVGNAGILLTRIEYLKHGQDRNFAIVDCAMNDLMRPALYDAYHDIVPVLAGHDGEVYEVVGPVCETGDFLGHARTLPAREGDLLAILSAGAYGMSMSSNYNSRPRVPEILVDGHDCHVLRERETLASLTQFERIIP